MSDKDSTHHNFKINLPNDEEGLKRLARAIDARTVAADLDLRQRWLSILIVKLVERDESLGIRWPVIRVSPQWRAVGHRERPAIVAAALAMIDRGESAEAVLGVYSELREQGWWRAA